MVLDVHEITKAAEKDYERAWIEYSEKIPRGSTGFKLKNKAKRHPVFEIIQKFREILLEMGFEEIILPVIVEEGIVYREYGPEAPVILDRIFYLATLPRPDIGISREKVNKIREIVPGFDREEELKRIFREYKRGGIEADELIEYMVKDLGIRQEQATKIIDEVFPELKELKPIPTKLTLRSHMTALWFPVLEAMQYREPLPIQLFTIGEKFRREQRLDETHLYSSYTASLVIMNDELGLEDGKNVCREIVNRLGFSEVEFRLKDVTSKYYAAGTEFEVFVRHPKTGEWIEIGDGGMYSPVSLAMFNIEYPVFNVGFGIERIAMIITGETDVRRLVYPYFYTEPQFSPEDLASMLSFIKSPKTREGEMLANAIVDAAVRHADEKSPAEVVAWRGRILGKRVTVTIWERDPGVKLLGPAALNEVWIVNDTIIGVPPSQRPENGYYTGIRYIDGIAKRAAAEAEEIVRRGEKEFSMRVRIVRGLSDINLKLQKAALHYITSKGSKIDIRGPVFVGITVKVDD
ncbi:MAG: O-phosphoserine--tRNA ligase [Candidatus Baldrarchaeia archaeon]